MQLRRLLIPAITLAFNFLFSLTVLPFVLPPFQGYTISQLFEVIFWQIMGVVGWPIAILGAAVSAPFGTNIPFPDFFLILLYPSAILLLFYSMISRKFHSWQFIALHLIVTISFAAVWIAVLNGYVFMP